MSLSSPSSTAPQPVPITAHQTSRVLEVAFDDGSFSVPFELMRVCSPSAEVQGHGPGQDILQVGKRDVVIREIEAVGRYGVRPTFSDGHETGIYTWAYLYRLGSQESELWRDYEERLRAAGTTRESPGPRG